MKRCHLASGPPLALHKCINFPCNQVAYKVPPAHVQHLYQTGKPSIYAFSASGAFSRAPPSSPLSDQSAAVMQISSSNWACVCAHLCSAFRRNTCSAGRPKTLALQAMQQATHALIPKPTTRVRLTHNTNTHEISAANRKHMWEIILWIIQTITGRIWFCKNLGWSIRR